MSYIILPSRRTRQPQGAVSIRDKYAAYVACVYAPWISATAANNDPAFWSSNGTTGTLATSSGLAGAFAASNYLYTTSSNALITAYPYSVFALLQSANYAPAAGYTLFSSGNTALNLERTQFDWYANSIRHIDVNTAGFPGTAQSASVLVNNVQYAVAGVSYSSASRAVWVNGANKGTNTSSVSLATSHNQTRIGAIAKSSSLAEMSGSVPLLVALRGYGMTDAEVYDASQYPYAFWLVGNPRRIYFGAGATGGGNITFEALPSSLSLAGSLANLWANRLLTANPASFTFAGAIASTKASRKVLANPSTLTMTGATGTLKWNRVFVASPGTLGFTGSVANFLLGKILTANPGSLNLTGATATVKKNSFIIADPGLLNFVGQPAGLYRGRIMTANPGSLTLSGAVASLFYFRVLPADPGTLALTGAIATLSAPGTVQRARPSSDISSNGWLPSSGADLYAMLDETSYNDSDYIYSPDNPTTQAAEVKFSAITDPGVNTGHVLRFRLAAVGQDTVFDVYLMCGATQIATWQKTVTAGVTTTYSETLTVGEAGNITDYSDLRIKVVAHA